MKYATCLSLGGNNGFPVSITQIINPHFRQIAAAAMVAKEWTIEDLTECRDRLNGAAELILLATLEKPVWNEDDQCVFQLL